METRESAVLEEVDSPSQKIKTHKDTWESGLSLGIVLGVGISIVGAGLFYALSTHQQKTGEPNAVNVIKPALTVTTVAVEQTQVELTLDTTGTVAARDLIPILPQANGLQVKKIPADVQEGNFVRKGQTLAILDDSILQTQINQAKAGIVSDQADMISKQADVISKQASMAANQAAVQQRKAELSQAEISLEEAQKYYQRYHRLAIAGAISHQELDTRYYTVKTAIESVRLARENLHSAIANLSSAQANIGNAQALVNKSKAVVHGSVAKAQELNTQLGQTVVRSPVAGIIAEKLVRVGDVTGIPPQSQVGTTVGGTQKLFSIIKDGKLELQARLPQVQLSEIKVGAGVKVISDADRSVYLQGRVRKIEPLVDEKSREGIVKIDLPPTNLFKVGMFAQGKISLSTSGGIVIPQKALRSQTDGSLIVFTLAGEDLKQGKKVHLRTVHAQKVAAGELVKGDKVVITKGLHLDDRVVVDGAGYLKDGDRVQIAF